MLRVEQLSPGRVRSVLKSRARELLAPPSLDRPSCPMRGSLPIDDRCFLHDSLSLIPELVSSADGHEGPETPADPHDTVSAAASSAAVQRLS